jgi:hypothetical protein
LHFHNHTVDSVRQQVPAEDDVFKTATRIVRWHYQWIVLHEFLPFMVGQELVRELLESGPKLCRFDRRPFIPVEFSDGAYRFGHAQIRETYNVNKALRGVPLFPYLVGVCSVSSEREVDWRLFFQFEGMEPPQASRRIGPQLVPSLMRLPEALVGKPSRPEFTSLASRDLYRGHSVGLPSGEAVARNLGLVPCTTASSESNETPLWLYVLTEAASQQAGERLGEVGGRIVAEVVFELLRLDPTSFLVREDWRPEFANANGQFGIADLLRFAQVA